MNDVILHSIITCPIAASRNAKRCPSTPTDFFMTVRNAARGSPKDGDSCVFYSVPCPPKQTGSSRYA